MSRIGITESVKAASVEELEDYSLKLGWDLAYSQLGPTESNGGYLEGVGDSLITTREQYPSAISMNTSGLTGQIAIAQYHSENPGTINGMTMRSDRIFMAEGQADISITTKGAGDLLVALIPESEVERQLGDSATTLMRVLGKQSVCSSQTSLDPRAFQRWFKNWSSNSSVQKLSGSQGSESQLVDILGDALCEVVDIEHQDRKHKGRNDLSRIDIDRLIGYFRANPQQRITTDRMIHITGLSRRNLFYSFKKYTGYTPLQYFNLIRLSSCHKEICRQDKSVTVTALDHNFSHLGDFSAFYKSVYGNLPSETRRKFSQAA